jgi:RNA-directed DNA polymerase
VSGKRPKAVQLELAFAAGSRGEAPKAATEGTEPHAAARATERPAGEGLMEEVCRRENLTEALKRVRQNKGSPGIDGMTVGELPGYLREHWPAIREQLLSGTYRPQPVRRAEIPKPGGGARQLGIPTVLDRFIQQAVMQVLQRRWDPTFSEHSYGFRPKRSAHEAVASAQQHIAAGWRWVVDLDLEKFFDRVNHDRLMAKVAERETDKRLLRLIRAYLNAGVMENGLVSATTEGTPQGGPLSPLLSNLVLDELDHELARRGLRFVRYADDCNIYVASERSVERVKANITHYIERVLRLKVNEAKSAVARPWGRKFLGFSFTAQREPRRRLASQTIRRLKSEVRRRTRRTWGVSVEQMVADLNRYLTGWIGYFGYCETPSVLEDLDSWIRRRLRCVVWKQWKRGRRRFRGLTEHGVGRQLAARTAGSSHGPWRVSRSPALSYAFPNAYWASLGLPTLAPSAVLNQPNRRVRTRTPGGVGGVAP